MERKISEWLRMIADPEIRKNAWENWKNRAVGQFPDDIAPNLAFAIAGHCNRRMSPQGWDYWDAVLSPEVALLDQPIPESEMDALNADPLYGGQKIIDDLKDEARRKHEEMRRKLWCDVVIGVSAGANTSVKGAPISWADNTLAEFDERFPNPIN
jgi:hypothetical protein